MVALTVAAIAFPPPITLSGGHSIILDSQITQFRFEPREKVFYVLVMLLSSLFGLIGSFMQQNFKSANGLLMSCLVLDISVIAYFADKGLNTSEGYLWGLCGILVTGLVALGAAFGGRFEPLSHR